MNGIFAPLRLTYLLTAVSLLGVAACAGSEIVGSSDTHVWVRNSVLSVSDGTALAQKYCEGIGKTAALESDLSVADGANNILVYACN